MHNTANSEALIQAVCSNMIILLKGSNVLYNNHMILIFWNIYGWVIRVFTGAFSLILILIFEGLGAKIKNGT